MLDNVLPVEEEALKFTSKISNTCSKKALLQVSKSCTKMSTKRKSVSTALKYSKVHKVLIAENISVYYLVIMTITGAFKCCGVEGKVENKYLKMHLEKMYTDRWMDEWMGG